MKRRSYISLLPLGEGPGMRGEKLANANPPSRPLRFSEERIVKIQRQYRGGYRFAGLAEQARKLRSEQTSAEDLLWQILRGRQLLGFKFRRQNQIGDYI